MRSAHFAALRLGACVLAVCGMAVWGVWSWREEIATLEDQGVAKSRLISLYTERLIQTQLILQQAVLRDLLGQPGEAPDFEEFGRFLADIETLQSSSGGLAILDAEGRIQAAGPLYPQDYLFPIEDYRAARAQGTKVYIGRTDMADAVSDRLFVASDFSASGVDGIFVSMVALGSIRSFLQQVAPQPDEAASLLREDGYLLLRRNVSRPMMLDPAAPAMQAMQEMQGQLSGSYRAVAVSDGVDRLYAFTRLSDLPLMANYGMPVSAVRAGWLWRVGPIWMFLGLLALFIYVLAGRIRRAMELNVEALETRQKLEATQKVAEQRARLMQELSHRVKNNLALVLALIDRQIRTRGRIEPAELRGRIMAIAEVHSMLFAAGDRYDLDFGRLINRLSSSEALIPPERSLTVESDVETGIRIGPDSAVPLALAATELLTNAVKHAHPDGRAGHIRVGLHRVNPECAQLSISDDGVGIPRVEGGRHSGLGIVEALVGQADATLERRDGEGTRFVLTFPIRGHVTVDLPAGNVVRIAAAS
ncbi:sensor histidine kinase [Cereibacter sediminicola]|uniref:sensor histidine kinase n=1 Tax=Cereibacter sediminicola TaxID=2584941 RepID=UPI00119DFBB6|nr:ATP-binding protein [Cereibacter sediminicola]